MVCLLDSDQYLYVLVDTGIGILPSEQHNMMLFVAEMERFLYAPCVRVVYTEVLRPLSQPPAPEWPPISGTGWARPGSDAWGVGQHQPLHVCQELLNQPVYIYKRTNVMEGTELGNISLKIYPPSRSMKGWNQFFKMGYSVWDLILQIE